MTVCCVCVYVLGRAQITLCHIQEYRICQNIQGGKLLRFSRILAKRECFTIETFPASQLENNYRSQ